MVSKTRLSIQDYFKHAGIDGRLAPGRAAAATDNGAAGNDFAKILDNLGATAQPPGEKNQGGMQIGDYWQRPIRARMPVMDHLAPAMEEAASLPDERCPMPEAPLALPDTDAGALDAVQGSTRPSPADRIATSIQAAAARYDLPTGLIHSVIRAESNFQPQAVSRAGAQGLMQLMPGTAEELGVEDPFDIEQNIDGGARYLRQMLDRFGGDVKQALAAYNAGPGTVMRYNGNVPYAETRDYVQKVLRYSKQYRV